MEREDVAKVLVGRRIKDIRGFEEGDDRVLSGLIFTLDNGISFSLHLDHYDAYGDRWDSLVLGIDNENFYDPQTMFPIIKAQNDPHIKPPPGVTKTVKALLSQVAE